MTCSEVSKWVAALKLAASRGPCDRRSIAVDWEEIRFSGWLGALDEISSAKMFGTSGHLFDRF